MIPRLPSVTSGDGLMNQHFESDYYFPFGYIYTATPEDLGSTKMNHQEVFDRTFGQHIIYQLLGAGSLTDYLGKCYSQSLVRQPFDVANAIFGLFSKWYNKRILEQTEHYGGDFGKRHVQRKFHEV